MSGPWGALGTVDNGCPLKGEAFGKVDAECRDVANVTRGQSCTSLLEEPQSLLHGQAPRPSDTALGLRGSSHGHLGLKPLPARPWGCDWVSSRPPRGGLILWLSRAGLLLGDPPRSQARGPGRSLLFPSITCSVSWFSPGHSSFLRPCPLPSWAPLPSQTPLSSVPRRRGPGWGPSRAPGERMGGKNHAWSRGAGAAE